VGSSGDSHEHQSFPRLTHGLFLRPLPTLRAVAAAPRWRAVLLGGALLLVLARGSVMATGVGRLALVDQWVRQAEGLGIELSDDQYARLLELSDLGVAWALVTSVGSGLVLPLAVAAGLRLVARTAAPRGAPLALAAHANLVLVTRDVLAAPLNYAREAIASPLTLGTFFPMMDEGAAATRFLFAIDLFVVWWLVLLALATTIVAGWRLQPVVAAYCSAYVAFGGVLALVGVLANG